MGLLGKAIDLIRANINDLLENAEDPEKAIKLYLADARDQLKLMTTAMAEAMTTEKMLDSQLKALQEEKKRSEENAKTCVANGRDDLATRYLEQVSKVEGRMEGLKQPLSNAHAQVTTMREKFEILKEKIEDTDANAQVLIARAKSAKALKGSSEAMAKISGGSPLDNMKSLEEKIGRMEAQSQALDELSTSRSANLDKEFETMQRTDDVQKRLQALKDQMK